MITEQQLDELWDFSDAAPSEARLRAALKFLQIDALHLLAIADVDHEAEWSAQAIALGGGSTGQRTRRWLTSLHNNHGWTLYDAGDRTGAIAEFELTLELAEAIGTPTQQQ